jgi:hypothetical protein
MGQYSMQTTPLSGSVFGANQHVIVIYLMLGCFDAGDKKPPEGG